MLFFRIKKAPKIRKISSLEHLSFRLSWMRGITEFEIFCEGETCRVTQYRIFYSGEKKEKEPERQAKVPTHLVLKALNDCGVGCWNGFSGKHPKGVTDGTMFSFEATVNGGEEIRAGGSENFPKGYREWRTALEEMLGEKNK